MKATFAIFIAAISFSFYPLLNTIALVNTSPFLLAMLSQLTVTVITFSILVYNLKSFSKTRDIFFLYSKLPLDLKLIPFLSGAGMLGGALFFIYALSMMSKAGATLIMETWPLLAIVFARALLSGKDWDPLKPLDFILFFIALLGMMLITASEANITLSNFLANPFVFFQTQNFEGTIGIFLALLAALCFAWASVARSHFADKLPHKMRVHFFGKTETLAESNFTYGLTYLYGVPLSIICYYFFEWNTSTFEVASILPIILISASLVSTSVFYAYGLLISQNANINLIWYFAPVLATVWLVVFGYSQMTPLLIIGGILIIFANIVLILSNKKSKKVSL